MLMFCDLIVPDTLVFKGNEAGRAKRLGMGIPDAADTTVLFLNQLDRLYSLEKQNASDNKLLDCAKRVQELAWSINNDIDRKDHSWVRFLGMDYNDVKRGMLRFTGDLAKAIYDLNHKNDLRESYKKESMMLNSSTDGEPCTILNCSVSNLSVERNKIIARRGGLQIQTDKSIRTIAVGNFTKGIEFSFDKRLNLGDFRELLRDPKLEDKINLSMLKKSKALCCYDTKTHKYSICDIERGDAVIEVWRMPDLGKVSLTIKEIREL